FFEHHRVVAVAKFSRSQLPPQLGALVCPDGWSRYQDSCYYIETAKMSYGQAERACSEKGATLFVADSVEEFVSRWFWIGLGQGEGDSYPQWQVAGDSRKWLILPFSSSSNGWSSAATCVGHYNGGTYNYLYFYPCSSLFYSVCEKNSTLIGNRINAMN
ncbi:unnamed protein product, partial [Haemonchus placei]|uniref:C-type lectin domain-containing protein n=1 Tax=Haemonchus placei TaxID=6290 RepID=A0A0N4WXH7_HAEPC